jgi:heat-inducible transcriptional repressor
MDLDERKRRILEAIINDYIETAEPIGSRSIAKRHELGLSSATIRNEMSDLEEMGYLEQPHTSAGRIPSDLGYRLYVDELMKKYKLTVSEIKNIQYALDLKVQELDRLIQGVSEIISKITNYTAIAMTPYMKKASIKHLQLMLIDESNVLLIIVTDAGVVKNKEVHFSVKVNNEFIVKFTAILNDKLVGVTIEQIDRAMLNDIYKELGYDENVVLPVLSCIISIINEIDSADIFLGGATNIFNYPEYNQVIKAKEILSFLEEKKSLYKLFAKVYDNKEENKNKSKNKNSKISIVIGKENEFTKIKNCSVIMTNYSIGEKVIGSIGIIGPTRMEYAKVVSSLEFLTMHLNSILTKLLYEE